MFYLWQVSPPRIRRREAPILVRIIYGVIDEHDAPNPATRRRLMSCDMD
jgi:hypothetical protein